MANFPARLFAGSPIATSDTVNAGGANLASLDCSGGVRAGAKCFNRGTDGVSALQYFTLLQQAAAVDHITVETALNFPGHQWVRDAAPGGGGTVTSVGSADGSVVITNPTTTPDLSVRVLSAATPAALAAINVNTAGSIFKTGSHAFVTAMRTGGGPGVYTLQPAISTTPDSFYVIATADDAARQWVFSLIQEQGDLVIMTLPFDLTAIQTVTILPPVGYLYQNVQFSTWVVTAKDGTVTTGPIAQMGTNAGINDLVPSGVQTGVAAQAVGGQSAMTGGVADNGADMSTNGIRLQITTGAILGTATVFKARIRMNVGFVKI